MLDEKKINSREQHFLALVFTSFGETRGWLKSKGISDDPREQEMTRYNRVMRVIDNRTERNRTLLKDSTHITSMDTVLTKWQFSIYNPKDPNLLKILRYDENTYRKRSMKNAVRAYIRYEKNNRNVPHIDKNVYHYVSHSYRKLTQKDPKKWYHTKSPIIPPRDAHHAFFNNVGAFPLKNRWGEDFDGMAALFPYVLLHLYAIH